MEFIAEKLLCMCNILLPNTKIFLSLNIFSQLIFIVLLFVILRKCW